jgi:hypothetical protein
LLNHTRLATAMPAGATIRQIPAKCPIYKGYWEGNNLVSFKKRLHPCFLLTSRQDLRQPFATRAALGSQLI